MQIYAMHEGRRVIARGASRSLTYSCPECNGSLRIRGGPSKQIHFYHLSSSFFCRQHKKSEEHMQTQLYLASLTGEEAHLEYPFPQIQRISDVAWEKEKLIFEVQCSPISLEEARSRCEDYEKEGYAVLWILHDKQFNKRRVSAAEEFLRSRGAYYTNMNKQGKGIIYDQFEVIEKAKRMYRGPSLAIPLLRPCLQSFFAPFPALPQILENRLSRWKLSLAKDLGYRILQEGSLEKTAKGLIAIEKRFTEKKIKKRLPWLVLCKSAGRYLLHKLLKAAAGEGLASTCLEAPLQNKNREILQVSPGLARTLYREKDVRVTILRGCSPRNGPATVCSRETERSFLQKTD